MSRGCYTWLGCFIKRKAEAPWSAPTGKCSSARKVRTLTFIAEGYLTRGARRCSWTLIKHFP